MELKLRFIHQYNILDNHYQSYQSGIETGIYKCFTCEYGATNRTKVELKLKSEEFLMVLFNRYQSYQSGIETWLIHQDTAISYLPTNRTKVELKHYRIATSPMDVILPIVPKWN